METSTNKQGTVVEQPVEMIAGSPPVCSLVNAERRERRFADAHAHDDTEHVAIVDTDITDDVHKATASPTINVSVLAADGETESHSTGVDFPEVMTVDEVAARARLDTNTVYGCIRRGELALCRCGRIIRIHREAVLDLLCDIAAWS